MGANADDPFEVSWAGDHYLIVAHKEGDKHRFRIDGRRIVDEWITPAAAFTKHLDAEQSLSDAKKHSAAARAAAEDFLKRQFE